MLLEAISERISEPEQIAYVLRRVEKEIAKLHFDLPGDEPNALSGPQR